MGFFRQLAEVFPWHIVWVVILFVYQIPPGCLISDICTMFGFCYVPQSCINHLHELFDTDKLINIDIMNFPRFQQFSVTLKYEQQVTKCVELRNEPPSSSSSCTVQNSEQNKCHPQIVAMTNITLHMDMCVRY